MSASTLIAADFGFMLNGVVDGLERLAPYLADSAAKSVVILLAATLAVLLLRRKSAAARHLAWTLGLAGLVLLPLLSAALPRWYVLPSIGLGPIAQSEPSNFGAEMAPADAPETRHGDSDLAIAAPEPAVAQRRPIRLDRSERESQESPRHAAQPVARTTMDGPTANNSGSMNPTKANESEVSDAATADATRLMAGFARWADAVWMIGAVGLLARLVLSWVALLRIDLRAEPKSDASLLSLLNQSRERIGVRRPVTLLSDSRHAMPLTWGTLRPRLLLPAAATDWPAERQQVVLLHELAHIKRWDYAAQLVAQLAAALYWFNPLVWWAKRRMTVEREVACDDVVLAAGERPSSYAEHLLSIAKCAGDPRSTVAAAAIAMARPTQISSRISAILDRRRSHAVLARRLAFVAFAVACAICIPLAMLRAVEETEPAKSDLSLQATEPRAEAHVTPGVRSLYFPDDQAIGVVYSRMSRPDSYKSGLYSGLYEDWQQLGEAHGEVQVPRVHEVRLDVGEAASKDLTWTHSLQPDDIQMLMLEETSVDDEGLRHVGRLSGLMSLHLEQTRITDKGIAHLKGLKELRYIDLNGLHVVKEGYGVGDEGLAVLSQLPKLEMLVIVRTNVTDAGIAHLRGHRSLKSLSVWGSMVTDRSLETIATLSALERLSLGGYDEGARITNNGLVYLTKLKNLRSLGLGSTQVNNDGLVHLQGLENPESLSLTNSNVTGDGLASLAPLADSLKEIRIYGTQITDAHVEHLGKLTSLEEITAHLYLTDDGVKALSTLTSLKEIDLSDRVTDAAIPHIVKMKSLESLSFQSCPITDAAVAPLASLPNLEDLRINYSRISSESLRHLKEFPSLKRLRVRFARAKNRPVGEELTLKHLQELTSLEFLTISGEGLRDRELAHLAPLKKLEHLDVGEGCVVSDEGLRQLVSLPAVSSLRIEESTITDTGLAFLEGMDNLEYVTLACLATDEGLKHLQGLPSLRYFQIASPHVTEAGLAALKESLPGLQDVNMYPYRRGEIMATLSTKDLLLREGKPETRILSGALEDRPPPPLVVENWLNTDGKPLTLDDLRGKVVMLDFWGVWNEPCREAMPRLKVLYEKYMDDGFVIVGVHTTDDADQMAAYVEAEQLPWPVAADVGAQTVNAFHVNTYPDVYFIDRAGVLRMADLNEGEIEKAIEMLLAEEADGVEPNADTEARRSFIVHGLITDQANQPLAGVEVVAHSGVGTLRRTGAATTDASGRYALRFGPGMLMATADGENSLGVGVQAATISPRLDGWYEVNLHRQGNLKMAEKPLDEEAKATWGGYGGVVLPREPFRLDFVMAQAATIEGRLVNDFGRPVAGERVALDGEQLPPSSNVLDQVETDRDGRFRIENVPLYRQWHFSLRVHGTRHELTTEPIELDEPQRYAYELVLKSNSSGDGAAELGLSAQESAEQRP